MTLDEISSALKNIERDWTRLNSGPILELLAIYKAEAITRNDQNEAKAIWGIETSLMIQSGFIQAFQECKQKAFYKAWCSFERVEHAVLTLERHFPTPHFDPFKIRYIWKHTKKFQSIFPYKLFISPEFVKQKIFCSICGKRVSLRSHCGHRIGQIYNGELCSRILKEFQLAGMALVTNPVQKYSVAFAGQDDPDRYPLLQYLIEALSSPFHEWNVTEETQRHPHSHFKHVGRNEKCPCGSEKKYKKCCLQAEGVLRPHFQFTFSVPPPANTLKRKYL